MSNSRRLVVDFQDVPVSWFNGALWLGHGSNAEFILVTAAAGTSVVSGLLGNLQCIILCYNRSTLIVIRVAGGGQSTKSHFTGEGSYHSFWMSTVMETTLLSHGKRRLQRPPNQEVRNGLDCWGRFVVTD
jgi:hypothetical protein